MPKSNNLSNYNTTSITPEKYNLNSKRSLADRQLVLNDAKCQTFKKMDTPFGEFINDQQYNIISNLSREKHVN